MLRERGAIDKLYVTITSGRIEEAMRLKDEMTKDKKKNIVSISEDGGKLMVTEIFPLACSLDGRYTLVQVKINTGRTHQIRVQLAGAGHPIIGDTKYGSEKINQIVKKRYASRHICFMLDESRSETAGKTARSIICRGKKLLARFPGILQE